MSLFGGGGSKTVYVPQPAPPAPTATSKTTQQMTDAEYAAFVGNNAGNSYITNVLGGPRPNPKKSYTSALFSGAARSGL
jgi:hypothetical protein